MLVEEDSYTLLASLVDEWRLRQAPLCNYSTSLPTVQVMVLQNDHSEQQERLWAGQPSGIGVFQEHVSSRNPGPRRREWLSFQMIFARLLCYTALITPLPYHLSCLGVSCRCKGQRATCVFTAWVVSRPDFRELALGESDPGTGTELRPQALQTNMHAVPFGTQEPVVHLL